MTVQPVAHHLPANCDKLGAYKRVWIGATLLTLAGLAAYANSFSGVFLFDDVVRIVEEPRIRQLGPLTPLLSGERPVVDLTLAFNNVLGDLNPRGYHAFNLAIHILAGLTLFGIVRRTIWLYLRSHGGGQIDNQQWHINNSTVFLMGFAVALIFLVHPLQTESVTYIIQRGESMMGLFYVLTLYCAIRSIDSTRRGFWFLAAMIACGLGMATKAVMVTAPAMVILYDWVFLCGEDQSSKFKVHKARIPFYVGLCTTWVVLWLVGIGPEVLGKSSSASHVGFGYKGVSAWQYAISQPGVIVKYIQLAFWPASLCLDYNWPVATQWQQIIPPTIVTIILLILTAWFLWHRHWLGFLGAWFFLILAPTSSFVPIKDVMFEHRMYLPLAAIIAAVIVSIGWLTLSGGTYGNYGSNGNYVRPAVTWMRRLMFGLAVLFTATPLAYATHVRNRVYHSELAMWKDVARKRPGNARAYIAIGNALAAQARLDEALEETKKAVEVDPKNADAHCAVGLVLVKLGRVEEAIAWYYKAVEIDPSHWRAWYSLGNALEQLGRHGEAVEAFQKSVEINPGFADAWSNLGNAKVQSGDIDEGIKAFQRAIEVDPHHAKAHNNLGDSLQEAGKFDDAENAFRKAIEIKPDYSKARLNLALLLERQGRVDAAKEQCKIILQFDPGNRGAMELMRNLEGRN